MQIYMKDGKALKINGGYLSPKASGETWVLNEYYIVPDPTLTFNVDFESNGNNYSKITVSGNRKTGLQYDDITVSFPDYRIMNEYREIILANPATGELLTWLQANGTKQ